MSVIIVLRWNIFLVRHYMIISTSLNISLVLSFSFIWIFRLSPLGALTLNITNMVVALILFTVTSRNFRLLMLVCALSVWSYNSVYLIGNRIAR